MSSGDILPVMQDIASIVYSGDQPILLHFLKVGWFFFFVSKYEVVVWSIPSFLIVVILSVTGIGAQRSKP